jgi:hypothetical protein
MDARQSLELTCFLSVVGEAVTVMITTESTITAAKGEAKAA